MNWKKINHGGQPMSDIEGIQRAIFIGRYQTWHDGHAQLIDQKLKEGIPVLILIRDIEPDEKNPRTAVEVLNTIQAYYENKKANVLLQIICDIESVNFGRGVGYEINEYVPPKEIGEISGTKIRAKKQ